MTVLSAPDGYRLWAATYAGETAISFLENELAASLTPPLAGLRLLDAGCGIGRRLHGTGAASVTGVDISPEMLAEGHAEDPSIVTIVGDIRDLPLPDSGFDMIWCRLVIGHLRHCTPVYRELARVAEPGARLIVTDFHPRAYEAGHRRSFRHDGTVHEIEHYIHELDRHLSAAARAGWRVLEQRDAAIGPSVRRFYEQAGRAGLYGEHDGLPVVLGLAFAREA